MGGSFAVVVYVTVVIKLCSTATAAGLSGHPMLAVIGSLHKLLIPVTEMRQCVNTTANFKGIAPSGGVSFIMTSTQSRLASVASII